MAKQFRYRKYFNAPNYSIQQLGKDGRWHWLYDAPNLTAARHEVEILQHCQDDWNSRVVTVKEITYLKPV